MSSMDARQGFYPIVRVLAALALITIGASAMYATIVVPKPIAAELSLPFN